MLGLSLSSCPFQSPFYFMDSPLLESVLDEFGNIIPDQVGLQQRCSFPSECVQMGKKGVIIFLRFGLTSAG